MPYATQTIDASYLSSAGSFPISLAGNTIYTLAVDINVTTPGFSGQPFLLPKRGTQLKLAGHTIRVQGRPVRQGLDSDIMGWTSEFTTRIDPTVPLSSYNGVYWSGQAPDRMVDPGTLGAYRLSYGNDPT